MTKNERNDFTGEGNEISPDRITHNCIGCGKVISIADGHFCSSCMKKDAEERDRLARHSYRYKHPYTPPEKGHPHTHEKSSPSPPKRRLEEHLEFPIDKPIETRQERKQRRLAEKERRAEAEFKARKEVYDRQLAIAERKAALKEKELRIAQMRRESRQIKYKPLYTAKEKAEKGIRYVAEKERAHRKKTAPKRPAPKRAPKKYYYRTVDGKRIRCKMPTKRRTTPTKRQRAAAPKKYYYRTVDGKRIRCKMPKR